VASWRHLGRSWVALGRSWGALGRSWGALGTLLGRSGARLGHVFAKISKNKKKSEFVWGLWRPQKRIGLPKNQSNRTRKQDYISNTFF